MLIRADGIELEIMEGSFVCLESGETSNFCEWNLLDEDVRENFRVLQHNISKILKDFLVSDKTRRFLTLSDQYEEAPKSISPGCIIE